MSLFYPIQLFADWLTYDVFGIDSRTLLADAVNFFIYDVIKIFILLTVIVFIISLLRSYVPPEKIRVILSRKKRFWGNIMAAVLGIITPFCTCSAIPLFLGFLQAGVPIGVTFSFLVASPMINEVALVLLIGLFGWKVALVYIFSGLMIAIFSGVVIGRMKVESLVEPFVYQEHNKSVLSMLKQSKKEKIVYARGYTLEVLKKVWLYVLLGIGVGAWIHGYLPADFLAKYAGADKWYAVPLAVAAGIPLYANAAGVIPLVGALTEKGVAMGTTLSFMMAVTALSLPEFMILKKIMKKKLIIIFASVVGLGIILTGYLFNAILK